MNFGLTDPTKAKQPLTKMIPLQLMATLYQAFTPPPYIVRQYTFPHIPYHIGLKHIHSPDKCVEPYALVPPDFKIVQTFAPHSIQDYNAIGFCFTTALSARRYGTMFSSSAHCSHLLLMDGADRPCLLVTYSVKPYVPRYTIPFEGGHTLLITGSYFRMESDLFAMGTARLVDKAEVQRAIQLHRQSGIEDKNLVTYRRRVLG